MPKGVGEDDLLSSFALVVGTLCAAFVLRIALRLAARLASPLRAVKSRPAALLCISIAVLLSLRTGLTPYIVALSAALALAVGAPSPSRLLGAFLLSFALLLAAVPLLGPAAPLRMPPGAGLWASRFYGEVALWPAATAAAGPRLLLVCHDAVTLDRELCLNASVGSDGLSAREVHIVSVADRTRIRALGGCAEQRDETHRIALLGPRARIEDVTLRLAPNAYVFLAPDAVLVNVAVEQYDSSGRLVFQGIVRDAKDCAAAASALEANDGVLNSTPLRCEPQPDGTLPPQLLIRHEAVPNELAAVVPLAMRIHWHAPEALFVAQRLLTAAVTRAGAFAHARALDLFVTVRAAHCVAVRWGSAAECAAGDWRAHLGAWAAAGACDALRALLDALNIVPGLGAALAWTWRVEWDLTCVCVQWVWRCALYLPQAALWLLHYFLLWAGALLGWCTPFTSRVAGAVVAQLCSAWVCLRAAAWDAIARVAQDTAALFFVALRAAGAALAGGRAAVALYGDTSLSAHVFVALVQSALLGMAVGNEVHAVSQREHGRIAVWAKRIPGSSAGVLLTTFFRVHSVASARYVITHIVLLSMLMGLSFTHLLTKLYNLTLYMAFPWVSSHAFLSFFFETPSHRNILLLSLAKGALVVIVDCTVGSFVSHVLREVMLFIAIALLTAGAAAAWRNDVPAKALRIYLKLTRDDGTVATPSIAATNAIGTVAAGEVE